MIESVLFQWISDSVLIQRFSTILLHDSVVQEDDPLTVIPASLHCVAYFSKSLGIIDTEGLLIPRVKITIYAFLPCLERGDWKCGSGKCDTSKIARVENAGVEKAGVDSRGGKCRSKLYGVILESPALIVGVSVVDWDTCSSISARLWVSKRQYLFSRELTDWYVI